jgi:Kef-type K+ transport system membrane component KefB
MSNPDTLVEIEARGRGTCLSNSDLTSTFFLLLLLVGLAQLLGYFFVKIRQPRVVGEIVAGVLIGPSVLGQFHFAAPMMNSIHQEAIPLSLFYWLGLLLLMFLSGAEARQIFGPDERRDVAWLTLVGTGIPFLLGLALGSRIVGPELSGPLGNTLSLTIIMAVGVAVTSVPVVSKIFADLGILRTRFARLILGVAVLEDIVLWLSLAVATAVAGHTSLKSHQLAWHLVSTVAFFVLGLTLVPRAIKRMSKSRFNVLAQTSPVSYVMTILLAYCALAGALDVSMVFAAFLAGFAVVHKKRRLFEEALGAIGKVSFAVFIPVYFAIVGLKLDLVRGFSLWMVVIFLAGSCLIKVISVAVAGRFAGFRGLELVNLAVTMNARGGPGIVLASVAFDAGIISPKFYTTLIIAAVLTSQAAGAWLDLVLRRGWPLLKNDPVEAPAEAAASAGA